VFFIHYFLRQVPLAAGVEQHYNNTYNDFTNNDFTNNDFTNNDFTYNSNKGDITYMFLFTVITKAIYKKSQL